MYKLGLCLLLFLASACVEAARTGVPLDTPNDAPGVTPDGDSPALPACASDPNYQLNEATNKRYRFYDERRTWNAAMAACDADSAHLAIVDSSAENQALVGIAANCDGRQPFLDECDTWIGLTRVFDPEQFVWLDGSPLRYENWQPNKPDNDGGEQHCVELNESSEWDDDSCGDTKRFICECDA